MLALRDQHGTTLLEAVVAASLLVTVSAGTASLIVLAHRVGVQTEQGMTATTLAAARLQALRAVPWHYEIDGSLPEVSVLAYSPPDALDRNATGYWDVIDESGGLLGSSEAEGAAFVRRWAVWPVTSGAAQARALEVCVFAWPADGNPVPLACLAGVRTRQP
jgi:hypothetical protein